jgi:hypothetical protein
MPSSDDLLMADDFKLSSPYFRSGTMTLALPTVSFDTNEVAGLGGAVQVKASLDVLPELSLGGHAGMNLYFLGTGADAGIDAVARPLARVLPLPITPTIRVSHDYVANVYPSLPDFLDGLTAQTTALAFGFQVSLPLGKGAFTAGADVGQAWRHADDARRANHVSDGMTGSLWIGFSTPPLW